MEVRSKVHTAEGDAGGSDNTSLNHGVLLASERLLQETGFLQKFGPCLHEEEAEKSGGDIERRNNTGGQVKLHDDESEQDAEYKAHNERSHRQLFAPRRNFLRFENLLHRHQFLRH